MPKKSRPIRLHGSLAGRLTTKIHALVDACGLPSALKLTEGQAHDGRAAADMLGSLGADNILPWRLGQCQTHATPAQRPGLQLVPLPLQQFDRALLQQAQHFRAVARRYDKPKLTRIHPIRLSANLDAS